MCDSTDSSSLRRRLARALRSASLLAAMLLAIPPAAVHAEVFNVPCDSNALGSVLATANSNNEHDLVWLAPSCTYLLTSTWGVLADSGNPLRVYGRNATLSGQDARTVLVVNAGANLHLSDVTLRDGKGSNTQGGAVRNLGTLTLQRTTIAASTTNYSGAGAYNAGALRATRSTFAGNTGSVEGGGIANAATGRLALVDSTIESNSGTYGGGLNNRGRGAIFNSTLLGNAAFIGGGVLNEAPGHLLLSNVTIARNETSGSNGGSGIRNQGTLRIDNSLVAEHLYADCYNSGTISPLTNNLIEDGSCSFVGSFTGPAKLGGASGSPRYLPLAAGSAALDTGQNITCARRDQRGKPRPFDGDKDGFANCDLGAYEAGNACGLVGIEGFALLPFVGWLRRRCGGSAPRGRLAA